MIITDKFIMLNLPKTGSTFARKAIIKAHENMNNDWLLRARNGFKKANLYEHWTPTNPAYFPTRDKTQHGSVNEIPASYRTEPRELMTIVRNPFDACVSYYEFKSFERRNLASEELLRLFPRFPHLSFNEYLNFSNLYESPARIKAMGVMPSIPIGSISLRFIEMFSTSPKEVLREIGEDFFKKELHKKYFPAIRYLRNENLSKQLYEFLKEKGYPEKHIQFILKTEKKNVSVKDRAHIDYYDDASRALVNEYEWFMFQMFPEYNLA